MKIGIIEERKSPPDTRVPFTPSQLRMLQDRYEDLEFIVQPSETRCYTNDEYDHEGIFLSNDLSECDILMGVKEVPMQDLIPKKTYCFFSHTIKEQPYNAKLLATLIYRHVRMVDYETLTHENGMRVLGFGRYAGIVGAHNALLTLGRRTGAYDLKAAHKCHDYEELKGLYGDIDLPNVKIVVTGSGRVAQGTTELLDIARVKEVSPAEFINDSFDEAVYVRLNLDKMYQLAEHRDDGGAFEEAHFFEAPEEYVSTFEPYWRTADVMINAIYWDPAAPLFFTHDDMRSADFKIRVIADVTCDIDGSVPATIKASTISDPIFGYDPQEEAEAAPHQDHVIDMMTVDNLPNELPRDASEGFGADLSKYVIDELLNPESEMIQRASICKDGGLTDNYLHLERYAESGE